MKIVVALGGNALQSDPENTSVDAQLSTCKETAKSIVDLIEDGNMTAIVHGNGPQVGQIVSSIETAHRVDEHNILFPFDVCGAFSQGYIGYHLQNAISEEIRMRDIEKSVATIITQIVVDKNDPGFKNPTKPIGAFYNEKEADRLHKKLGYMMKEDAGRGYRRVVPSPKPIDIVEKDIIRNLIDSGNIVISCGGGGIPVIRKDKEIHGVSAVIDKDFAAGKLAETIDADALVILTAVDKVCINFNKPNQKELSEISVDELDTYIDEGQFASGSMLPKVEACKRFVLSNKNRVAIIASLSNAKKALKGEAGTRIIR